MWSAACFIVCGMLAFKWALESRAERSPFEFIGWLLATVFSFFVALEVIKVAMK